VPTEPRVLFAPQAPRTLRPDAASNPALYRRWAAAEESWRLTVDAPPAAGPALALLMVVGGLEGSTETSADGHSDASAATRRTLDALAAQTALDWSLSVVLIGTPDAAMEAALTAALGPGGIGGGGRVRVLTRPAGTAVASAYAAAFEESGSPAFAFLDPGDELAPDAVARLSAALVDADVAYGDEDRIGDGGDLSTPVLKPDWSPELLLSWNYVGRPLALRVAPVIAAGGIRPDHGGDWEHDLLLRVTERTRRVAHVAAVLCHRDPSPGSTTGPAAVVDALERRGDVASVHAGPIAGTWELRRAVARHDAPVKVSAIVPFRDSTGLLRSCADALDAAVRAGGRNGERSIDLELVLVDNGSTEPETATLLDVLSSRRSPRVQAVVRRDDRPFNWAALNNAAAAAARGDVLLFVNDDVSGGTPGWLGRLVSQALRPEIGAVGARLVYPDGRLQHAGIVLGLAGATGHVLAGLEPGLPGYLGMAVLTRDVTAVTGACMATRREVFTQLGGFDEELGLDFNDVDYCLRARRRGLRVILEAGAELIHHESPSRGTSGSEETAAAFLDRWRTAVDDGDPFYNRNLSHLDFSAALDEPGPVVARAVGERADVLATRSVG
jgi:GT2 family glycosyltransferase